MDLEQLGGARRVADAGRYGFTRANLRSGRWARPTHGVVRVAGELDPVTERLATAIALATDHCVLGGWAALRLQGNPWFDGWSPNGLRPVLVHCEPGSRLRARDVVTPFRGLLHPDEWGRVEGVATASIARAAFDEMRLAPSVGEAVVVADMAASTMTGAARTTLANIGRTISAHHKVRGIVQATTALTLATERSASSWESRTRMLAHFDAQLRSLLVNVPIFDEQGTLLGIADLLDEESGLVIESDGDHHRDPEQHADDNRREEGFERAGLVVVRVSSLDHGQNRADTARRIRRAHQDALSNSRRSWTIEPPPWWDRWSGASRWL